MMYSAFAISGLDPARGQHLEHLALRVGEPEPVQLVGRGRLPGRRLLVAL